MSFQTGFSAHQNSLNEPYPVLSFIHLFSPSHTQKKKHNRFFINMPPKRSQSKSPPRSPSKDVKKSKADHMAGSSKQSPRPGSLCNKKTAPSPKTASSQPPPPITSSPTEAQMIAASDAAVNRHISQPSSSSHHQATVTTEQQLRTERHHVEALQRRLKTAEEKVDNLQHQLQQKNMYEIANKYKFCASCQRTYGANIKPKSSCPTCGRVSLCPQCGRPF